MSNKKRGKMDLLEHYKYACLFRTARQAIMELLTVHPQRVNNKQLDKLERAERHLDMVRSQFEDMMFREYPMLSNKWVLLYYGTKKDATELIMQALFDSNEEGTNGC